MYDSFDEHPLTPVSTRENTQDFRKYNLHIEPKQDRRCRFSEMDIVVAIGEDLHDNGRKTEADETDGEMERKCFPEILTIEDGFL